MGPPGLGGDRGRGDRRGKFRRHSPGRAAVRSLQEGSIQKLVASSRDHEAAGELDMVLVDLDAALELASRSVVSNRFPIEEERQHRGDLARREAGRVLENA